MRTTHRPLCSGSKSRRSIRAWRGVIAEDDCPAALAQVRTWRERLPRLVGPSAAHFLDGEGFATACGAGKSRAWIDDFIVDLQAVVIDGTRYATVFVEYVREQGAEAEAPTEGGAL